MSTQRRTRRSATATVAAAVLVTGLLSACSSSSSKAAAHVTTPTASTSINSDSGDNPTSSAATGAPATSASTDSSNYAEAGTATDSQGDAATFHITFGTPAAVSAITDPAISVCSGNYNSLGTSADRSLAVPVQIAMNVTSMLGVSVSAQLLVSEQATTNGNVTVPDGVRLWADSFSNGPQCWTSVNGDNSANVTWNNASRGTAYSFDAWLIIPGAITPNDPTGIHSSAQRLLLTPTIKLAGTLATFDPDLLSSSNLVTCSDADPAAGNMQYLAINQQAALAAGCSR